jgi:hypothetical protein
MLSVVLLFVVMLSVVLLNVILLSVVLLNVVAPNLKVFIESIFHPNFISYSLLANVVRPLVQNKLVRLILFYPSLIFSRMQPVVAPLSIAAFLPYHHQGILKGEVSLYH